MVMKYLALVLVQLKWALYFLLYHPFYKLCKPKMPIVRGVNIYHYGPASRSEEEVDCAVCLCKINAEGEEIGALRCGHVFHRICLDRWVGLNVSYATCPICGDLLGSCGAISELGAEVIDFQVWSISSRDRERWWLR